MWRSPDAARYFRPNHNVAMPRNEKKPTTSVIVVTKVPDATAGSDAYGFDLVAEVEAMSPDELVTAVAASDLSSSAGAHPLDEPAG